MQIVYLDQNKWIELARAAKSPSTYPEVAALLVRLMLKVESGQLALPLTAANLYETQKINKPERRHEFAHFQVSLSRGRVFRGRHRRLEAELGAVVRNACGLPPESLEPHWFLSEICFEAFLEWDDPRLGFRPSEKVAKLIRQYPLDALYEFLTGAPDDQRMEGVKMFSAGAEDLRQRIEARRSRLALEKPAMRRKALGALLLIDEIDLILELSRKAGAPWASVADIGRTNALRIIDEVPLFNVERELVLRIEALSRPISENDFRDMQTLCAVATYADIIVVENLFGNLARQAGLDKSYNTFVTTSILDLVDRL